MLLGLRSGEVSPLACQVRRFLGQGRQLAISFTGRCRTVLWSSWWKDGESRRSRHGTPLPGKGGRVPQVREASGMSGRDSAAWAAALPGFCSHQEGGQESWGTEPSV